MRILKSGGARSLAARVASRLDRFEHNVARKLLLKRLGSAAIEAPELYSVYAAQHIPYAPAETVEITANSCPRKLPSEINECYLGKYRHGQLKVAEIQNATLHEKGTALTEDGSVIMSSIGESWSMLERKVGYEVSQNDLIYSFINGSFGELLSTPDVTLERGFNMVRQYSFYHWVTEYLPMLRGLEAYEDETDERVPILVESNPPPWVIQYLSLLGLEDQIIPLPSKSTHVKRLLLAPRQIRTRKAFNPSTDALKWVSDRYRSAVGAVDGEPTERIYISRNDAEHRHILNEPALLNALEERGFMSYTLSELSITEQIHLFSNAEFIIGAHGAGLANMIYADEASVLEILPRNWVWHDFYCMANQLKFDYDFYQPARPKPSVKKISKMCRDKGKPDFTYQKQDVIVDDETVLNRVDSLLSR